MKEQAGVTLVAICGSWVAISGAIWKVAERADQVVSPKGKQVTADWLESDNLGPLVGIWADVLAHSFDNVFGKKPLSWRFFRNSCCASVVSVLLVAAVWAAMRPQQFLSFVHVENLGIDIFSSFLAMGILNFVPDYLSVVKGRMIIARLQRTQSRLAAILLVACDMAVSAAIGFLALFALSFMVGTDFRHGMSKVLTSLPGSAYNFLHYFAHTVLPLQANPGYPATGSWFYATFFTSLWVLLHVASGALLRIGNSIGWVSRVTKTFLNIREQPMFSLAVIARAIVTISYIGIAAAILI